MSTAVKDNGGWNVAYTIDGVGEKTITFQTLNQFVDANARVTLTTPAASNPSLTLTDIETGLSMGNASNGVYSPTVSLSGIATIETDGWIAADDYTVADSSVSIGTVNQSILKNGQTVISSGDEIIPTSSSQTITITEGYNSARTLIIGSASSSTLATITSGAGTATISTPSWDSTSSAFTQSASGTIAAPSVETAGYISTSQGTRNTNSITGSKTLNTISLTLGGSTSSDHALGPEITEVAKGNSDSYEDGALTTGSIEDSAPSSGAYIKINSAACTATFSPSVTVASSGYGTSEHYGITNSSVSYTSTVPATNLWLPIKTGSVTSGTATISSATFTYNSTSSKFDLSGSANVSAPTVGTAGWIGTTGTKNSKTNGATLSATVDKIGIQANLSGTGTKKPSITKHSNTNVSASSATTTQPSSGYYVAVSSAANTGTVKATATVTSAGYGTTTTGQYTTTDSSDLTIGASASSVTYVPITAATFANSGTSGTTYTDISSSAPALISGDYLYINAGYVSASKISLAKLVPDASGTNAAASYILADYTAYDNDGVLIVGTMATYDGSYTIT